MNIFVYLSRIYHIYIYIYSICERHYFGTFALAGSVRKWARDAALCVPESYLYEFPNCVSVCLFVGAWVGETRLLRIRTSRQDLPATPLVFPAFFFFISFLLYFLFSYLFISENLAWFLKRNVPKSSRSNVCLNTHSKSTPPQPPLPGSGSMLCCCSSSPQTILLLHFTIFKNVLSLSWFPCWFIILD